MHYLPALNHHTIAPRAFLQRVGRALQAWGRRQWLALCEQAERPTRRVPRY